MGSGCSSPLRRLGGKRGKSRRESSPFEINGNSDNQDQHANATTRQQQQQQQLQARKLNLDNEVTIQSEINDDHPSSASYYTDGKNQNEETKISEHSEQKSSADPVSSIGGGSGVVARMMAINGNFMPHDRHLLVSPALSPAPSTCYSPSSAGSLVGCSTSFDLSDLNEAFKTLTFGLPDQANRIKQPERPNSELHNYYTQQLVQTQSDLINYISVIFITTDTFQFTNSHSDSKQAASSSYIISQKIELLANHIESNSKSFCDEHLFDLRFFNLSLSHLSEHFHINNLVDVSMKILKQEYQDNGQRLIIVVLSNSNNIAGGSLDISDGSNKQNYTADTRQLPTRIEAQLMNKLIKSNATNLDDSAKDIFKRWYNQLGNVFYLNPIYLVYPTILNQTKEERDQAWHNWLRDSSSMIKAIELNIENDPDSLSEFKFESLFGSQIEFIMKEPGLQKRTLLIRNYLQPSSSNSNLQQQLPQHQPPLLGQDKYGSLSELARLLSDPNKLTIKRAMSDEEFIRTVNDWINENLNKFVESILDNQIVHGKHIPPFVERSLFRELTSQRHHLENHLVKTTENFEDKCSNFYSSQISPILNGIVVSNCNTLPSCTPESTLVADQQQSPVSQPSANHLVFISGPKGCGKSTLFAQMIRLTAQDVLNKALIIYRFCGVSLDSLTPNRLLRSICEQFCQTQGENITAASYIYSARKEIINALNKIMNQQTSIIFLDGLDVYDKSILSDLDWLYEIKANSRVKIFIMLETDTELYKKVLGSYSDATYISLDHPTTSEWAQMLTSTARSKRFNSVANLYDEIKVLGVSANSKEELNLTYKDISDVINMCRIRQLNNESIFPELTVKTVQSDPLNHMKNVQQMVLKHLQYLLTPYQLCSLFVILDSCRNGLNETDIINVMTLISQTSKSGVNNELRFSSALLNYLRFQLQPWLIYILCDKTVKIFIQKDFLKKAIENYLPNIYPNIMNEVKEIFLNYFSRQTKSKLSKSSLIKGDSNQVEFRDCLNPSESLWLSSQASEVVNLLISTNPAKAKDYLLNKNQFFMQFLYSSMPEEFIEDCQKLKDNAGKKTSSTSEELQCLVNFIMRSIHPLRYDGSQIFSQIYCRAYETVKLGKFSKSKKFNDLLNLAACPPIRNLLPISEASVNSFIKTRIGQKQQNSGTSLNAPPVTNQRSAKSSIYSNSQPPNGPNQSKQKIYTIKDNHRHVIVIYPDKGSLSVWDIFEEKAVRTISNIDQPRDLRMIDQKRAVILCNRELRVYDLDSGIMLTKLKGVMNQKMPFFEVFEENYVVALARNRMYVNMLNLNTGELETTFKVGEDRFLNSLLVSANGGICVCGDETQKPFPLLVWNLNERRLLYDLRLDRHEFITRMSAISDDGHFVVSVCRQLGDGNETSSGQTNSSSSAGATKSSPNFIVIYDLNSGTLFKKWKPGLDSCSVAITLSANRSGKVINTIIDSSILVWDLATGSKR